MQNFKKILNSTLFLIPAAFIFVLSNIIVVVLLYFNSSNLPVEIIKWFQIFILLLLLLYLFKRLNRYLAFTLVYFLFFIYLILVAFIVLTGTNLDFSFLQRNFGGIGAILPQFSFYLLALAFLALINSLFLYVNCSRYEKIIKIGAFALLLPLIFITCALSPAHRSSNELFLFAKTIYKNEDIINYYQDFYDQLTEDSSRGMKQLETDIKKVDAGRLPAYLDNIIILQIESLNGFLANEDLTPNLVNIAKEGVFFPRFYGNSMQTILAQETILCSLPSSFDLNLVSAKNDKGLLCLPEILKNIGYKNFFYKSYDLDFADTGQFMRDLQFDEVHADDIMQPGDAAYPWGYKEEIFYERAFADLSKKISPKNNFLFIEIGPTNHWPFKTPAGLEGEVPYDPPLDHLQRLSNTTFLQDKYLKSAWTKINSLFPEKNYTLLILGDHSWPAGFHPGNYINIKNAYEENFMTSLVLIIGQEYKNKVIEARYSQMDILPSLLGLFNLDLPQNGFRTSFLPRLAGRQPLSSKIIQIQPYGQKFISVIDGFSKYQYNGETDTFIKCGLAEDPDEKNCKLLSDNAGENLAIIKNLLPLADKK